MRRARALVSLFFATTIGCYSWRLSSVSDVARLQPKASTPVMITTREGKEFVLRWVDVRGDTLFGLVQDGTDARLALPVADIRSLQLHLWDRRTTRQAVLLAAGASIVAFVVIVYFGLQNE